MTIKICGEYGTGKDNKITKKYIGKQLNGNTGIPTIKPNNSGSKMLRSKKALKRKGWREAVTVASNGF